MLFLRYSHFLSSHPRRTSRRMKPRPHQIEPVATGAALSDDEGGDTGKVWRSLSIGMHIVPDNTIIWQRLSVKIRHV